MNKNYEAFRNNIFNAVSASGLEYGAVFYILRDVLVEIERQYSNAIRNEMMAEAEANARAKEESDEAGVFEDEPAEL